MGYARRYNHSYKKGYAPPKRYPLKHQSLERLRRLFIEALVEAEEHRLSDISDDRSLIYTVTNFECLMYDNSAVNRKETLGRLYKMNITPDFGVKFPNTLKFCNEVYQTAKEEAHGH